MKAALALIFLFMSCSLFAHDLYLQPDLFRMDAPGFQNIEMHITENRFPGDPIVWRGDKTLSYKLQGPTGLSEIINLKERTPPVQFKQPGTYQIGWERDVTYISINPVTFNQYINLEGYRDVIAKRASTGNQNAFGRERYRRYVKTFVQVGETTTEDFLKPFGFKIEIIPQKNPFLVRPGEELEVQLLYNGKPLAGSRIMATYDQYSDKPEDYEQTVETDSRGMAKVKITKPGLWLVRANHMIAVDNDEKADWESFWSNITFEIK